MRADRLSDALAGLRHIAEESEDAELRFFATRIVDNVEMVLRFKSGGMYTEAKYTARFVKRNAQEFGPDTRADGETRVALDIIDKFADEILELPDTVRTIDRSATAVQSKERPERPPGPYSERYPVGSPVRIAALEELEKFMSTYKYHHALVQEQLRYAGMLTIVRTAGYYHGGDVVYTLEGTGDFAWLEPCLRDGDAA